MLGNNDGNENVPLTPHSKALWEGGASASSASSFSFIYPTGSSGTQSIHSHAVKIEVITQKILEMNAREEPVG